MIQSLIKKLFFSRNSRFNKKWKYIDFVLWGVPIFLSLLGGLLIASTQRQLNDANWYLHWFTALIGFGLVFIFAQYPLERIKKILIPIYLLTVLSLIAVTFLGTSAFGAQRWLSIGGINIQPSEIAKLTSILVLAGVLERYTFESPKKLLKPLIVIFIPWLLVFIQPDLGTSLVFGAILLIMLYWSGMPIEWGLIVLSGILTAIFSGLANWVLIFWIPLIGLLAYRSLPKKKLVSFAVMGLQGIIAWMTPWLWTIGLKEYQRERLTLFLDPAKDPLGGGYHLLQSQIGIGSGGLWGAGLLQGQLTRLHFIPEQHTDFIFSALGEESGFFGTVFVITVFFLLMVRLLKVARNARTDFESLVVIGIGSMFMFQVIVNICMTIGLGPVTGIPLPFLSYGRTALLVNFIAIGLCISVSRRSKSLSRRF
tara:strand:+ start:5831 stop:7102 length:1272 start_codon:yes stop_codon:yes gene_type:complete